MGSSMKLGSGLQQHRQDNHGKVLDIAGVQPVMITNFEDQVAAHSIRAMRFELQDGQPTLLPSGIPALAGRRELWLFNHSTTIDVFINGTSGVGSGWVIPRDSANHEHVPTKLPVAGNVNVWAQAYGGIADLHILEIA